MKKLEDFNADERVSLRLLENHVHFLTGEICEENVQEAIRWITFENLEQKSGKVLTLYINSYGGDLYQAFALIDIMRVSKYPIRTIGIGTIMSAAFLIFASGDKGQRFIAQNTGIMCHQFSESTEGKYHDIRAALKETENANAKMVGILQDATGLTAAKVRSKLLPASDVYLSAQDLVDLSVADHILGT